MWPFSRVSAPVEPRPPSALELAANRLADAEFPGQKIQILLGYGFVTNSATLVGENRKWLAELWANPDGSIDRVRLEKFNG